MTKIFGIDVSYHNGAIDWTKVKNDGVKFAILRAGRTSLSSNKNMAKDIKFEEYYEGAKAIGLPVGAYYYSRCATVEEGKKEGEFIVSLLKGKNFEYPIFLDVEDKEVLKSTSKKNLTDAIKACMEVVEKAGYYVAIYSGKYILRDNLIESELTNYDKWIAQYAKSCTYDKEHTMWQFGGETNKLRDVKIKGISSASTDQNYCYKDYPSIIKSQGLNGYSKTNTTPSDNNSNKNDSWVLRLQKELNKQGFRDSSNKKLSEDGIAGSKTLSACPTVKRGAKGNITRLIQEKVNIKVDGSYGTDTYNAVKKYQTNNKLSPDGIVGKNTWKKLLQL